MDYIQEELRRQREALAAVLLGGGTQQASEDGREAVLLPAGPLSTVRPTAAEQAAVGAALTPVDTMRLRLAAEGGTAGADSAPAAFDGGPAGAGAVRSGEEPTAAAAESGWAGLASLRERGRAAPSPGAAEAPGAERTAVEAEAPGGGWAAAEAEAPGDRWTAEAVEALEGGWPAAEATPRAARQSRGARGVERTVTELVYPAGNRAAVTAESLSRAFQRDARRYDGGFSPY